MVIQPIKSINNKRNDTTHFDELLVIVDTVIGGVVVGDAVVDTTIDVGDVVVG